MENLNKLNLDIGSLNLNLLAINNEFQSKGIGEFFFINAVKIIQQRNFKFNLISCEAPNENSSNFYKNKLNFDLIGKKIRLFKNFFVFLKKEM